jgi:hypothetical protein
MKFENNFDSFDKLKKFSSNPEEVDLTDKKEISKNLTRDDNEGNKNKEVLIESVAEDDVDLDSDKFEKMLGEKIDKEEEKVPLKWDGVFSVGKVNMKSGKDAFIKEGTVAKKQKGKAKNPNKKTAKAKAGRNDFRDAINRNN